VTKSRLAGTNDTAVLLYQNRAACNLKLGFYDQCITDCNNALEINPSSIKALYRRACALEKIGKFNDSKRDALIVLKFDSQNKDAVDLIRRLNQTSNTATQGLHRLLDDLIRSHDANAMMECIEMIRAYCEDDEEKHFAFAKYSGLEAIDRILLSISINSLSLLPRPNLNKL
jgi:tetratricopeptide (TPR) repeat protein